ncbi:MAG: hypothetical protein AB1648_09875 [Pseudomonadota bacterium]
MSRLARYREIVALALKDQRPKMWRELEEAGELDAYLTEFAEMMVAAFNQSYGEASHAKKIQALPYMEKVGALNALERQIEEMLFAELLEFPPDDTEDDADEEPEASPEFVAMIEQMSREQAGELVVEKKS